MADFYVLPAVDLPEFADDPDAVGKSVVVVETVFGCFAVCKPMDEDAAHKLAARLNRLFDPAATTEERLIIAADDDAAAVLQRLTGCGKTRQVGGATT